MHKFILIFFVISSYIFANINVVVTIAPLKSFVEAIGKEHVDVTLMVAPGHSPHNYEPKPSQMLSLSKAKLYFAIGVEFEEVWLPKFASLNPHMKIVDLSEGIEKISMKAKACNVQAHEQAHQHHHHHTSSDPHIWTSPENVKQIAAAIYKTLKAYDPQNASYYQQNYQAFISYINQTHTRIQKLLAPLPEPRSFMVFHPSWGYFAKTYRLEQIVVEVEGKSPKPKELMHLIAKAKEQKVRAIFTQPEFSDASAKIIAKELRIPVVKLSPLEANWSDNLIALAQQIAGVAP